MTAIIRWLERAVAAKRAQLEVLERALAGAREPELEPAAPAPRTARPRPPKPRPAAAAAVATAAPIPAAGTKVCRGCGETKSLDEYTPDARNADGRGARCRPCVAAAQRETYADGNGSGSKPGRRPPHPAGRAAAIRAAAERRREGAHQAMRCQIPGTNGPCGAVVMGRAATKRAWDVHHRAIPAEELEQHFDMGGADDDSD